MEYPEGMLTGMRRTRKVGEEERLWEITECIHHHTCTAAAAEYEADTYWLAPYVTSVCKP